MKKEKTFIKSNALKIKTNIKAGIDLAEANKAEIRRLNKEIDGMKAKIGRINADWKKMGESPGLRGWIRKRGK